MLRRVRNLSMGFPPQFWLMFWGMLISTIGSSMIWPFLMIYVSERLKLPLASTASLMTLSSVMGLIASFLAGPIVDRLGRRWIMIFSLFLNGVGYLFLSSAETFPVFAVLMGLSGAINPLYRVGADAMMADLIPQEKRADAYAVLRMSNNVGVALGPAVGGFIAAISYSYAFYIAAIGMILYSVLLLVFAAETLPKKENDPEIPVQKEKFGGYDLIFKDKPFIQFVIAFTLVQISSSVIWTLLGVYTKQNFGLLESQYGLIPTTNAVMVITLQIFVTHLSKRYPTLLVMTVGSLLYSLAVGSIFFGQGFWGFWLSMVVMTCGELILMPTSSTYAANLAPANMRGRYMSIYGLTWSVAQGIGPVLGGFLNDNIGPRFIWVGGGIAGMLGMVLFLYLFLKRKPALQKVPD